MITLCDSTLRDGSHAKGHQLTIEEVRAVAGGLDAAGVPVVEVSHGDGLAGSSFNYGFSGTSETDLIEAAVGAAEQARVAVLLLPGIGRREDLRSARSLGAAVARIATHCTEADIAPQHIALARELGFTTVGFLMMAHMASPAELAQQATLMRDAGAQAIYVTDSAGALLPVGVHERVTALVDAVGADAEVGFHGHQNLSLAVANSLAAVDAGAMWIDACTCGMGAGAGNTPTEVFVAVCDRAGIETGVDTFSMAGVAEEIVTPILPRPQVVDRAALMLGYAGVYSSFLLHAEKAAHRFEVPVHEILVELGRRGTVGGQEDTIIDLAAELAGSRESVAEVG